MEMTEYIAKSNPVQTIAEHTADLLRGCERFFALYGEHFSEEQKELVRIACEYHDCGKAIYPFQRRIRGRIGQKAQLSGQQKEELESLYKKIPNNEYIPHGYISPAFLDLCSLENKFGRESEFCTLLILAIYYHHERESDLKTNDIENIVSADLKLEKTRTYYLDYISMLKKFPDTELWLKFAVIKGLLNKFDYHASSGTNSPIEFSPYFGERCIADNVQSYLTGEYVSLRSVQEYMRDNGDKNLVVAASTGVGKTEAALLWAGERKTFYTLPLKVSINAIYERIRKKYAVGIPVTLLHSDTLLYFTEHESDDDNDGAALQKYKESKALSYPVTVCTIDQLFAFAYKAAGSEILLAALKYSKLIIDEIQSYSSEITAKILYGLKLICGIGGQFAIITATMPLCSSISCVNCQYRMKSRRVRFMAALQSITKYSITKAKLTLNLYSRKAETRRYWLYAIL